MDRYVEKVDKSAGPDDCWPWTGGKDPDGYGIFWDGTYLPNGRGRYVRVPRWTYEQFVGDLPPEMKILHSCDNPPCVNPAHLSYGTAGDNNRDRKLRGRSKPKRGSTHVGSKLTEQQVMDIRAAAGTITNQVQADTYGVSNQLISMIITRKTWKWL